MKILRNPAVTPPHIHNSFGLCQSISALQVIIAAPFLLRYIIENNQCTPDVCEILNRVNSTETKDIPHFPDNLPYVFLNHEILLLMGVHKVDHGLLRKSSEFSLGTVGTSINDISLCLHNLYRIWIMKYNEFPRDTLPMNVTLSLRKKPFSHSHKDLSFERIERYDPYYPSQESGYAGDFQQDMKLQQHFSAALIFFLHHIFHSPEDMPAKEEVGLVYKKVFDIQWLTASDVFFDEDDDTFAIFFLTIDLLFVGYVNVEEKYYNVDGTITEYIDSIRTRNFNKRVLYDDPWMKTHCESLIHSFGYPIIVVTPHNINTEMYFASQLSQGTNRNIDKIFRKMLENVQNNKTATSETENILRYIGVSPYRPIEPDNFWKGDLPRRQELFRGFGREGKKVYYKLYAIHFAYGPAIVRILSKNQPKNVELPIGFLDRHNFRVNEVLERFKLTQLNELTDVQRKSLEEPFIKLVNDTVWKETLSTANDFHYFRQIVRAERNNTILRYYEAEESKYINYDTNDRLVGHSVTLIKSLSGEIWYLVSNSLVIPVENLKKFYGGQSYEESYGLIIEQMFWHKEHEYNRDAKIVRRAIRPIVQDDYDHLKNDDYNLPSVESAAVPLTFKNSDCNL
ncbi:hypothetical protein SNEBB_008323 [Seison nebaliae]|nr:hypothetical protein SNEBB_008323 [Seison nebaliae]